MTTLVLGATGFIGSAVIRQFATGEHGPVIGFVRTAVAAKKLHDTGITTAFGDLNDTESLYRAMSQVDTVISCVSYVGSDKQRCLEVNQHGMQNVSTVAAKLGIERLLYVSTAAVYGPGPFHDLPVDGAPLRPRSPASRTRAIAERYVRDVGGLVVRPHLVLGQGDRWVSPTLTRLVLRLGAVVDGAAAVHSVIDVDVLAASLCRLSAKEVFKSSTTLHINEPKPLTLRRILEQHAGIDPRLLNTSVSKSVAYRRAVERGLDTRHLQLISEDRWFRSSVV